MTDFEIVVVQNERARLERQQLVQEANDLPRPHPSMEEDQSLELNMISVVGQLPIPIPITPIHPTPSPTPNLADVDLAKADTDIGDKEVIGDNDDSVTDNPEMVADEIAIQDDPINTSNSSGTSGAYLSTNTSPQTSDPNEGFHGFQEVEQQTSDPRKGFHGFPDVEPAYTYIPFRDIDTEFMDFINETNISRKKQKNLISTVRPSSQSRMHHEFFICHPCHKRPMKIKLWETEEEEEDEDNYKAGYELPFVFTLRGIIDHLSKFHSRTHVDGSRDMVGAISRYIDMIKKDIAYNISPLFSLGDTIPKAPSTSCLNSFWKSDQTSLTTELAHVYNFQPYTKFCNGHPKLKATHGLDYLLDLDDNSYAFTTKHYDSLGSALTSRHGLEYVLDLADTVYCACQAPAITFQEWHQLVKNEKPVAAVILDPTLNISAANSFFNKEKKSISQSHKTVLCYFKLRQSIPEFPVKEWLPSKPTTRSDSEAKRNKVVSQTNAPDSTTSGDSHSGDSQSSPEQNDTSTQHGANLNAAPMKVRPRPIGSSPPQALQPPPPPLPPQKQPAAAGAAGAAIKQVKRGVATAASLLHPGRQNPK